MNLPNRHADTLILRGDMREYVYEYAYGSEAKIVLVHLLVHSNLSKLDAFTLA